MRGNAAMAVAVLALTNIGLGWYAGFRSLTGYLLFWLLCALVVLASMRIVRRAFPADGLADAILRVATLSFAIVVAGELLLGALALIGPLPHLALFGAIFVASHLIGVAPEPPRPAVQKAPLLLMAVLLPMLAFIVATGIIQSPLTLYDSLSYHLVFPARWLQDHRLSIVPTPFSDEAQAYAPANGELFFLWLMLPFHGDFVARIGQLPFYLLGGVALYALARRAGAPPAHAVYPAAFYFFSRPIVEQAAGADVDLVCWAVFLTSICFGIAAVERDERPAWILWGVSLGLYWGSKYVALVYTPVFLVLALLRGVRRNMMWALPGILLFAFPWYLRNWIVAGSPIYPSSLTVAGLTLAQGAYTRQAMQDSVFHTTNLRLFPAMLAHAMGTNLLLIWLPAALAGGWSMLRTRRRTTLFLLCVPLLMVPLYWFGIPDNVDSRFLLPAAMIATLPFAFVFRASRGWNAGVHAAFAAGLLWLIAGRAGELPFALPWYMGGWLSLQGLVARPYWLPFVGLALLAVAVVQVFARTPRRATVLIVAFSAACAVLTIRSGTWCTPGPCGLLVLSPIYVRSTMVSGWRWMAEHARDATIAYAGNNVPYPLFGDHLTNRVCYVNIDRHPDWQFHDYDKAHRRHRDDDPAPSAPLAVSSGVLMPRGGPPRSHADAVRPRYERMAGNRDAWIQNLKARGVDRLFVTALSAYEIDYNWHDAGGFPIEVEWAQSDPAAFTLLYENPQVKVFAVRPVNGESRP